MHTEDRNSDISSFILPSDWGKANTGLLLGQKQKKTLDIAVATHIHTLNFAENTLDSIGASFTGNDATQHHQTEKRGNEGNEDDRRHRVDGIDPPTWKKTPPTTAIIKV